jgi:hypothetical protein
MTIAAQDSSEEEAALRQRLQQALGSLPNRGEFVSVTQEVQARTLEMFQGMGTDPSRINSQSSRREETIERRQTLSDGVIHRQEQVLLILEESSAEGRQSFGLTAEIRHVGDRTYVSASYEEPRSDLPPLPDGWHRLSEDSRTRFPGLENLDLERPDPEDAGELINPEAAEAILENAASVRRRETTEGDTTFTVMVNNAAARAFFRVGATADDGDLSALDELMLESIRVDGESAFVLTLTPQNQLVSASWELPLVMDGIVLSEINPQVPDDVYMDMRLVFDIEGEYLNEDPGPPVEAPPTGN